MLKTETGAIPQRDCLIFDTTTSWGQTLGKLAHEQKSKLHPFFLFLIHVFFCPKLESLEGQPSVGFSL